LEETTALQSDSSLDAIGERATLLEGYLRSAGTRLYGSVPTAPGILDSLNTVKQRVETLKTNPPGDETQKRLALGEVVKTVEEIRTALVANLRTAVERAKVQLQNDQSPLVTFVYEPGDAGRLTAARQELERLKSSTTEASSDRVTKLEAKIAGLNTAVQDVTTSRKAVQFRFRVAPECSAIPTMIIYLGAILAFPAGWWVRMVGIFGGLPFLYVVNVLRLACLGVIGAFTEGGPWFKFSHEYIWQGIYIVFVVAVWMAWVEYLVRRRAAP
jgi:exosortase/archaeosortase family protein